MLVAPAYADQANVFIYHRYDDPRYPSTNTSLVDFQAHLDLLQQQEFSVLRLGEVVERLKRGASLPQRCAVITVDDAYRSFYTGGWPLLKEYGFPATLFVSTDQVGGGDFLDWKELRELQGEGVEIGNHSASHAYLLDRNSDEEVDAWEKRILADLHRSQLAFEVNLGIFPKLFAYPYGEFSSELVALVKKSGFEAAFGQQSGVITPTQDLYVLPRFPVGGDHVSVAEFREKLFMSALPVTVVSPKSSVLGGENPPKLKFYLKPDVVDSSSLRCFVPGSARCEVRIVSEDELLYEAEATKPITSRRSKYTLTASDARGETWYWFSQLWVQPGRGDVADSPVAR